MQTASFLKLSQYFSELDFLCVEVWISYLIIRKELKVTFLAHDYRLQLTFTAKLNKVCGSNISIQKLISILSDSLFNYNVS